MQQHSRHIVILSLPAAARSAQAGEAKNLNFALGGDCSAEMLRPPRRAQQDSGTVVLERSHVLPLPNRPLSFRAEPRRQSGRSRGTCLSFFLRDH
jgi:hypothetical protein